MTKASLHVAPSIQRTYLITSTHRDDRVVRDASKFVTRSRVRRPHRPGHYSLPSCPRIPVPWLISRVHPLHRVLLYWFHLPLPTLIFSRPHWPEIKKNRSARHPAVATFLYETGERRYSSVVSAIVKVRNRVSLLCPFSLCEAASLLLVSTFRKRGERVHVELDPSSWKSFYRTCLLFRSMALDTRKVVKSRCSWSFLRVDIFINFGTRIINLRWCRIGLIELRNFLFRPMAFDGWRTLKLYVRRFVLWHEIFINSEEDEHDCAELQYLY